MKKLRINKLSENTIEDLHQLASHFEGGIDIEIQPFDREITIIGVDRINDTLQSRRVYECFYGPSVSGNTVNDSDEMIALIKRDSALLEQAKLDEAWDKSIESKPKCNNDNCGAYNEKSKGNCALDGDISDCSKAIL